MKLPEYVFIKAITVHRDYDKTMIIRVTQAFLCTSTLYTN